MASTACGYVQKGVAVFFEYDTPKIVHIRSKSIGIFNRVVQIAIIGYIIGWVFIYKQGYQLEDVGVSGTTTKVKGVAYAMSSNSSANHTDRVWDAVDVVVPAEENNAFFVTTNMIVTNDQQPSVCPESREVLAAHCNSSDDCLPVNKPYLLGHGVTNGTCNKATNTCWIKAWCPLEKDILPTDYPLLNGTKDFTVLIKNHVFFPLYDVTRSNIIESTNKTYLQGCTYNAATDPFCPIFRIEDIVNSALSKLSDDTAHQNFDSVAYEGGVISIKILWDCNFNYDVKKCKPEYRFDRLDKGEDSLIARGYNYRYSNNYFKGDLEMRQQIKAYGILFIIAVDAKAGKFNVIPTLLNLGSGLALLSIATIICDVFVLYVHKYKQLYRTHKYHEVDTSYEGMQ